MQKIFTMKRTPSLVPGRTGWKLTDPATGRQICAGFCEAKKLPMEANQCAAEALAVPYEEIRKTFLPVPAVPAHAVDEPGPALAVRLHRLAPALVFIGMLFLFMIHTGYAAGTVNVRACASRACPVVATLTEGTVVLPAPGADDWVYALTPAGPGWIYGRYVQRGTP